VRLFGSVGQWADEGRERHEDCCHEAAKPARMSAGFASDVSEENRMLISRAYGKIALVHTYVIESVKY